MTQKAERGTKRTCDSCNARFYDLNREEIICPMCGAIFELVKPQQPEVTHAIVKETESKPAPKAAPVPEGEGEGEGEGDADDIDGGDDLVELDDDDTKVATDDDDALLPDEEDGEADVSGIIGGPISTEEEES